MLKTESKFACQACGYESPRWFGKCPECSGWNTFAEEYSVPSFTRGNRSTQASTEQPHLLSDIEVNECSRSATGIKELDRVLGGGIVAGTAILVGGEPGIGKSTLMIQIAESISSRPKKVLYVTGEESLKQIKLRAERLGSSSKNIYILPETNVASIESAITKLAPDFVIIDSIQTLYLDDISSASGSVSQVRECASSLIRIAKSANIPIFIVGHVTKEGIVAGPKILEHMVDTVLYFEGERHREYRILRSTKNRFGSVNEVGIFEMKDKGLVEVDNPSKIFLEERSCGISGSSITVSLQGSRPLLVEIQALVSKTNLAIPRRVVSGIEYNRLLLVIAVLERRAGFNLSAYDVHLSAAGGIKIAEPAVDLAIAASIVSCAKDKPISEDIVLLGEIGLGGELRSINQMDRRIAEAQRLGFKKIVGPNSAETIREALLSLGLS